MNYSSPVCATATHASVTTPHLFHEHADVWQHLAHHVHARAYRKDEAIFCHADTATHLWLVQQGWVKLTRQTPDGKETIIGLCTEGDVFGEAAFFANASYPYHAHAVSTTVALISIPSAHLRTTIQADAPLAAHVMSLLNKRIAQAQLKLEHMSTLSAAQRLGCFLLRLCHTQANGSTTLQIPVEKHILAAYLGMKPETLSRSQQQLRPVGITVTGQHLTIENIAQLREFVCNSCSESGSCEVELP